MIDFIPLIFRGKWHL